MDMDDESTGARNTKRTSLDKNTQTQEVDAPQDLQISHVPVLRLCPGQLDLDNPADITVDDADKQFLYLAKKRGISSNPSNFISLSLGAMSTLQDKGMSNLIYKFSYCIGTKHPDKDQPLIDLERMPFGLIEYQIEFFSCTNIQQVIMTLTPLDAYLFILFGNKHVIKYGTKKELLTLIH
jgi:hypothetical protein